MAAMEREFSCGGVVVRGTDCIVIVPARRAARGAQVLALPKGHPENGESPADAAVREVREEAGVEATVREKLGDVNYWYQRDGLRIAKTVTFFLLDYVSGEPADHDHEVEHARWIGLEEAARSLSYKGERDMAARALLRARPSG
jgi:8-oxo-dGTP pyrophosphatase MutT (NUDIX family)